MPLAKAEREFLDAYVYEVTHEPFGGPATTDLHRRGIHYSDLHWLLTAYDRALCAERLLPQGQPNPIPPPSPWANLEHAKRRDQELREELERQLGTRGNGDSRALASAAAEPVLATSKATAPGRGRRRKKTS